MLSVDLTSGHGNDLSRSCCIPVHASRQGKQIGTFPMSLSLFYQKFWAKTYSGLMTSQCVIIMHVFCP